jgi:hypothetical protein
MTWVAVKMIEGTAGDTGEVPAGKDSIIRLVDVPDHHTATSSPASASATKLRVMTCLVGLPVDFCFGKSISVAESA